MNHRMRADTIGFVLILSGILAGIALAYEPTPIVAKDNDAPKLKIVADCTTRVDGREVSLSHGESVEVGSELRTCERYDGHSLIVFSAKPPGEPTKPGT